MQPVPILSPVALLLIIGMIGFVVGVAITLSRNWRQQSDERLDADHARDSANPYEPSRVAQDAPSRQTRTALAFVVAIAFSVALGAAIFFVGAITLKSSASVTPPPPTVVATPQQAPAPATTPSSQ